jgi:peptidyl-prolyl cis-trans isomerase SurA
MISTIRERWCITLMALLVAALAVAAVAQDAEPTESESAVSDMDANTAPPVGDAAPALETTRQIVDGIAAVIGDEIILESEVDEEFYIYTMRTGATGLAQEEAAEIRATIVREMVNEMLLVAMAHRDTIELAPGDVESEMDRRIADLVERHGSQEALDEALEQEGMTLADLENLYEDEIERRLLAERVVRREVHDNVSVTWGEVESYYNEHTEEVGRIPEAYHIAGILITPKIADSAKFAAIDRLNEAIARIEEGEPFEQLAAEYSDDPGGASGGDLGTFGRGTMVPEFEDAVFAMSAGELSGIIPTRFGFHVVEVLDRTEDEIHARHILARVVPGPEDEARARATADSLRERALAGEDFAELARMRSDDIPSREAGGDIGWFSVEEIRPTFKAVVEVLEPGEIGEIAVGENGFYVLKLLEHNEPRTATLDEVREDLKDYLFSLKVEAGYHELIERLSREIFVDVRTGTVSGQ